MNEPFKSFCELAIDPADGFSIYYLSPTLKIAEDIALIEGAP